MPAGVSDARPVGLRALSRASYISFVPMGISTVLLGPLLPILSARWSLDYAQAGALFPVQYVASTVGVALSGALVNRFGFRFTIRMGLFLITAGLALLMTGPKWLAILCIAGYGAGNGVAVPAGNLMVAQINPERRSAALNWLNFCWSAGAVSCPFLVAAAAKTQRIPFLLAIVAASALALALYFTLASIIEPPTLKHVGTSVSALIRSQRLVFWLLAALFFLYVGTENGFGFWVASFAKSLGDMSAPVALLTPSFFYAALTLGRLLAPFFLRNIPEVRLAQAGLVFACLGMAGMILSRQLPGVVLSASAAGLGLSSVYPITISILSRVFGGASSKIGSIMFVLSNFGGGLFPWIVGLTSNGFGTLKAGLLVPLIGCAVMYVLYLQKVTASQAQCTAQ